MIWSKMGDTEGEFSDNVNTPLGELYKRKGLVKLGAWNKVPRSKPS